jgi:hypothetical protein
VKIEEYEEFPTSPFQVIEIVQGEIITQEGNNTNKRDIRLMSRETIIQLLFLVLHSKTPILDMCKRLVLRGQ